MAETNASEYERGQRAAANWWRISKTTREVATQRHDQMKDAAQEALAANDNDRYSYLIGMVDHFAGELS
jgi:hypothetical protein